MQFRIGFCSNRIDLKYFWWCRLSNRQIFKPRLQLKLNFLLIRLIYREEIFIQKQKVFILEWIIIKQFKIFSHKISQIGKTIFIRWNTSGANLRDILPRVARLLAEMLKWWWTVCGRNWLVQDLPPTFCTQTPYETSTVRHRQPSMLFGRGCNINKRNAMLTVADTVWRESLSSTLCSAGVGTVEIRVCWL